MTRVLYLLFAILVLGSCARPITKFSSPDQQAVLQPVVFNNESEKASTYLWDFGDGTTSTMPSPEHRYFTSGEYTIRLTATNDKGKSSSREEKLTLTPPDRCLVLIKTSEGDMIAEIFDSTPLHQDNFVKLVEQSYYDSLLFHRVIQGFMIQGGDPDSRNAPPDKMLGSGGPKHTVKAEFLDSLAHVKGALSAARTNNPQKRSSGSQFYIVQGKPVTDQDLNNKEGQAGFRYPSHVREAYLEQGGTPFLDQGYTVFGRVIEGLEVIDRIAAQPTNASDRPTEDVWMLIRLIR